VSPSMLPTPTSKVTTEVSSTTVEEDQTLITPSPPLVTVPRTESIMLSSETPGLPPGENKVTSEWPLMSKALKVLADS